MHPVERVATLVGGTWELYCEQRVRVVVDEIRQAGRTQHEADMILAEVRRLMKAGVEGRLIPFVDVDGIPRRPDLYELRWEIGGDEGVRKRLWRLYFVCQPSIGVTRWGLRFAVKPRGPAGVWKQDRDIDLAWRRFKAWFPQAGTR